MTGEERVLDVEHRVVTGDPALELRGVSALNDRGITALHDMDLTVRSGEILGIAGVSGNGQTELAEVICALRGLESGSITVDGADIGAMSVRAVTDLGVGHIPEDRIGMGMVLSAPVKDNAVLHSYWTEQFSQGLTLNRQGVIDFAKRLVEAARVQTRSVFATAGQLSGGNQQRLVARREALVADRLLVAAHPTRGLDVNAAQEVRSTILNKRDSGCAVLLISDDLDEVLLMSDRIAVVYEGRIMGVFDAADADREHIGLLMGGHSITEAPGPKRPVSAANKSGRQA